MTASSHLFDEQLPLLWDQHHLPERVVSQDGGHSIILLCRAKVLESTFNDIIVHMIIR